MKRSTLTISLDLEIGWGRVDDPRRKLYFSQFAGTRALVRRLAEVAESREVPMTWAVVGALCLEDREAVARSVSGSRRLVTRVQRAFSSTPRGFLLAPGLIEGLLSFNGQQLASHSFSHLDFGSALWSKEDIACELAAARDALRRVGVDATGFVFPLNHVGHLDLLEEGGFRPCRPGARYWYGRGETLGSKILMQADIALALPGRATPEHPSACGRRRYVVPFFCPPHAKGIRGRMRPGWILRKARSSLDATIRSGGHMDLWFHPHDFAYLSREHLDAFEAFLDLACRHRSLDQLEIVPLTGA